MRVFKTIFGSWFVIALLAGTVVHGQQETQKAETILKASISALGGEARLARLERVYFRCKATLKGGTVEYEYWREAGDRAKIVGSWEEGGKMFRVLRGFDGNDGWIKLNDEVTRTLTKAEWDQQDTSYENEVRALVPLLDGKRFKLALRADIETEGRRLASVRVTAPEHVEFDLYFDKTTRFLWKYSQKDTASEPRGKILDTYYGDYKDFDGLQYAVKSVMKINGQPFSEDEVIELRPVKEFPKGTFSKP